MMIFFFNNLMRKITHSNKYNIKNKEKEKLFRNEKLWSFPLFVLN